VGLCIIQCGGRKLLARVEQYFDDISFIKSFWCCVAGEIIEDHKARIRIVYSQHKFFLPVVSQKVLSRV